MTRCSMSRNLYKIFGELPAEVKNTISHRANALNKLKAIQKDKSELKMENGNGKLRCGT